VFEYKRDPTTRIFSFFVRNVLDQHVTEIYHTEAPSGILVPLGDFSPDGRWVVFGVFPQVQNQPPTRIIIAATTTGGAAREVFRFEETARPLFLGWAPDNQHILCVAVAPSGSDAPELWKGSVNGEKPQKIDASLGNARDLTFHPDGKRLAYTLWRTGVWEVWAMENMLGEPATPAVSSSERRSKLK